MLHKYNSMYIILLKQMIILRKRNSIENSILEKKEE